MRTIPAAADRVRAAPTRQTGTAYSARRSLAWKVAPAAPLEQLLFLRREAVEQQDAAVLPVPVGTRSAEPARCRV